MHYFITYFWSVYHVWELWDQIRSPLWGELPLPHRGETFIRGRNSRAWGMETGPFRICLDYPPKQGIWTLTFLPEKQPEKEAGVPTSLWERSQDSLGHCSSSHLDNICSVKYIPFISLHKLLVSLAVLYTFTTRWFFYLFHLSIHGMCWLNLTWSYCFGLE